MTGMLKQPLDPGPQAPHATADDDANRYRALSVWRPWPQLMFIEPGAARCGPKDVENRVNLHTTWRGELFIHAGKRWDEDGACHARRLGLACQEGDSPTGYIGLVTLVDVHHASSDRCGCTSPWAEHDVWHWVIANPRPFTTVVPLPGRQSLFRPDPLVVDLLPTLLAAA